MSYLNAAPPVHGLDGDPAFRVEREVPSRVARRLHAGEVALDTSSRTSAALVRILLRERLDRDSPRPRCSTSRGCRSCPSRRRFAG